MPWRKEIDSALARTKIGVLLVTIDFLASDFIQDEELPPLLEAAGKEGARIFWIPLSYCPYEEYPIAPFQAAWDPKRPILSLSEVEQSEAWTEIARKLKQAYEER